MKAIVPLLEFDSNADGQVIVDSAMVSDDIENDPRNGSLRPHW